MQYLKMIFLCALILAFGLGCAAGLEEDALTIEGNFFPLQHFKHTLEFPEHDRNIEPLFSEELTRC